MGALIQDSLTNTAETLKLAKERFPDLPKDVLKRASIAAAEAANTAFKRTVFSEHLTLQVNVDGRLEIDISDKPVEESIGEGIGQQIDHEEGLRRIHAYATEDRIEDWAGDFAGPGEIERLFGTSRSTLHHWQKLGRVVGLLKGTRKHVFPLAQFVDGRPVEGLDDVLRIIRFPRTAWRWLTMDKPSIGGSPLELLKQGNRDKVIAAAERDFG